MPRVPRLNGPTIAPNVVPRPTDTAASLGMPIAQAAATLGGELGRIAQEEREKVLQTQANAVDVDLRRVRDRLLYDQRDGALTRQRMDAKGAPDSFRERWAAESGRLMAGLDPEVRRRAMERARQVEVEAEGIILRHVTGELDKADAESRDAIREDALRSVAANPQDAALVDAKIAEAVRVTEEGLRNRGVDDVSRANQRARLVSGARLAQVDALAKRDPAVARETLDRVKDQLTPEDREQATNIVDAANLATESQRASDNLFAAFGPDDERAALTEARRQFDGKMRDEVERRVRVAYAEDRRLRQQDIADYTAQAVDAAYANRPIPQEARIWLEANGQAKVIAAAENVRLQSARGEPVETNLATYQELSNLLLPENRAKFLETNLLGYADRVSRSDLQEFIDAQTAFRGGTRRPGAGVATSTVLTETFLQARSSGMFDEKVTQFGDLETRPEDKEIYNVLRAAVETNLSAERAQKGELSGPQVRAVIQATVDQFVIERQGMIPGFRTRVAVPGLSDAVIGRGITAAGGTVTPAKIAAIRLLYDRTDLTPAQKEAEAERIAKGM